MFKLFSMLVLAGGTMLIGVNSAAAACDCGAGAAPAATARATKQAPPATARTPKAPAAAARSAQGGATAAQNGRQTIRRYSATPATSSRAAAPRRSRGWSGQSWNATQKVFGY